MALAKTIYKSRVTKERITLTNLAFARWLSRRKGVSSAALSSALKLIGEGIKEGMAEGYAIRILGIGTFEMRELPARNRYHRKERKLYLSPPSVVAHFKKSEFLTANIRKISKDRLDEMATTPTVKKAVQK